MSWQGQAKQPIMLRGRSVSAGVPDAPGPSPWISQASRAGLRCCVVVVDVFGQLSAAMWQARLVGTAAWRFGPTHVCQGVGCRYCDVSVPGDGRGSRGRTLGRGIRPALNPLLNDGLGETPLAAGRRSGPHGRMKTIPGANDIYRDRTARSRSWLRPWVASWPPVRGDRDLCLMRAEIARRYCRCRQATHGRSQLHERAVRSL